MRKLAAVAIAALTFWAAAHDARSQGVAQRQLTILVNYDPGGPTDLEARVFARHIGKHLPGRPHVIVQNMAGAAGLIGTKFLGELAPKDGSMMGYLSGATQRYVSAPERFTVDLRSYEFIATVQSGRIHFVRTDARPGIRAPLELMKTEGLVVGGLGRDQPKDLAMRLTLDMLGVPYSYVTGFNSSAQGILALQRNEISYYADSPSIYNARIEPLVKAGLIIPVYYDPGYNGTDFTVPKQMRGHDILPFHEYCLRAKGALPSGPLWDAYRSLLAVSGSMYRLLVLPPGTAPERVNAMRNAMLRLNQDAEFIEEARKTMGEPPEYVSHANLNEEVGRGLTVKPEVKAFLDSYGRNVDTR